MVIVKENISLKFPSLEKKPLEGFYGEVNLRETL